MAREIIATGRGSDEYNEQLLVQIQANGIGEVPFEIRREVFQYLVHQQASELEEAGKKSESWDLWWHMTTVGTLHAMSDMAEKEREEHYLQVVLSSSPYGPRSWDDSAFRKRVKILRRFEKVLFGEHANWMELWSKIQLLFEQDL